MPSFVGAIQWHNHVVAYPDRDLLEAAGAQILLARLEGVDEGDFEVFLVVAL